MTPDEIRAWAQQHGGDAGADPPDANGITVYRAADGAFIHIRRDGSVAMRGSGPPPAAPAGPSGPGTVTPVSGWAAQRPQAPAATAQAEPTAAAAAPVPGDTGPVRGAGAMQQQDVEQWIAQQGGQGRVQYSRATKQIDNPAADLDKAKAAGVAFDGSAPAKVNVSEEKWTAVDAAGKDTGAVLHVSRRPDGSFDIITQANPNPTQRQAGAASTEPPKTEDRGGRHYVWQPNPPDQGGGQWVDTGPAPQTPTERADANAQRPQVVAGTINTTSPNFAIVDPVTQQVTWVPNKNYKNPTPQPITLPNTRTITWDNGDGTTTTTKNDAYIKKSSIQPDKRDPSKLVNVTEDDDGNPVILPVNDQTNIKPADLPVLQTHYGQIAQSLGALAADLNAKYARGEITDKERTDAFAAAHGQAETAVSEINSILDNSKAIWSGQVTQRGQTLQDTQGRRSYASDIARSAFSTGENVALHSGRGSGAAIAAGVGALMRMGQRYAEGMGGFRESPEIALPAALQQAQGIGLPGFGGPPGAPGGPSGASGPPAGPGVPASGISNTTDAGGVPREYTPASSSVGSGMPPPGPPGGDTGLPPPVPMPNVQGEANGLPPPVPMPSMPPGGDTGLPPPVPMPGVSRLQGMGAALGAASGYAGSPVAAGGGGVFDPMLEAQGMLGDGSDPAWAEAVRRVAQAHAQGAGGYR